MSAVDVEFPAKLQCLFQPNRYKIFPHGRGAGTSWGAARALLLIAAKNKKRILCARETQLSITDSVHRLLSDQIQLLGLSSIYEVTRGAIRCKSGSEFIFAGIRTDPNKVKSTEGVDLCWVEEAEKVSEESWKTLIPTIRKEHSEIWVTFNPDQESDPTSQRFLVNPPSPEQAAIVSMTWQDNPWFPETLRKEKDYDYRVDAEAAEHTWGGKFRKGSQAQIFKGKYSVEEFDPYILAGDGETKIVRPGWTGPYFGADWGFSSDPDTLVKLWRDHTKLYIEYEAYGVGVELNQIPQLWSEVPGAKEHIIRADNSRPETIQHVAAMGFNVIGAEKWPGSVEDGIRWLRQHEQIVIHPRCKRAQDEARLYRYKVDPITGDVLPVILDKHNHIWDAVRYAMQPAIKPPDHEETITYEEDVHISSDLDELEMRQAW